MYHLLESVRICPVLCFVVLFSTELFVMIFLRVLRSFIMKKSLSLLSLLVFSDIGNSKWLFWACILINWLRKMFFFDTLEFFEPQWQAWVVICSWSSWWGHWSVLSWYWVVVRVRYSRVVDHSVHYHFAACNKLIKS